jgi:hypothetical protein
MLAARARLQSLQDALARDAARQPPPVSIAAATAISEPAPESTPAPVQIPNGPLRLTDDQLAAVLRAAEPLAVGDRGAFLQDVAAALAGQELGDGVVYRTIAQVQGRYYDPPNLLPGPWWGHQP